MKLIDKSALVAEIKRRLKVHMESNHGFSARYDELKDILSFLDTLEVKEIGVDLGDPKGDKSAEYIIDTKNLEVKEVDLEKEVEDWVKTGPHTSYPWCTIPDAIRITAEHFFELGLKTQKEE